DRKSTRLNSSHGSKSYAVFCLKKKVDGRDRGPRQLPISGARTSHLPRPHRGPLGPCRDRNRRGGHRSCLVVPKEKEASRPSRPAANRSLVTSSLRGPSDVPARTGTPCGGSTSEETDLGSDRGGSL